MKKIVQALTAASGLALGSVAFAATGGGATIHNAATLNFTGGKVTAQVNVLVRTVGALPTFIAGDIEANSGENVTAPYRIISESNGSDTYTFTVDTVDTDVSDATNLTIPPSITLGASITSRPSTPGVIYIAAGSGQNLDTNDIVRINIGGTDHFYTITSVVQGTPASTTGNTTTAEVPTRIALTPIGSAPAILAGNVQPGYQVGEVKDFNVTLTTGTPDDEGTPGTHEVEITVTAAEPGPNGPGDVVTGVDTGTSTITVLSGNAQLYKQVRNETAGGVFPTDVALVTSGITAKVGDVLEYRLTARTIAGQTVVGANIMDSLPEHTTYVSGSTTLNGTPVADIGAESPLFVAPGLGVNSPTGDPALKQIVDGEAATVTFKVEVK